MYNKVIEVKATRNPLTFYRWGFSNLNDAEYTYPDTHSNHKGVYKIFYTNTNLHIFLPCFLNSLQEKR